MSLGERGYHNLPRGGAYSLMSLAREIWESGCRPHFTIERKDVRVIWSSCGVDQAVCLEDGLVADVFGLGK